MTKVLLPHDYDKSVFINCPFDTDYEPLFNAMLFAVHHISFTPKSAKQIGDAGQPRFDRIVELIASCRYSIHDISRTELDPGHGLPRFNVPFELGLDLGCKVYGERIHGQKHALILDTDRHRHRTFISDIAGHDVEAHNGSVEAVITVVRNWLTLAINPMPVTTPSGRSMYARYQAFQADLPETCNRLKWDIDNLPFADFSWAVHDWIKNNPLK
jgi:hypothetical protein